MKKAILVLEDGTVFKGSSFGASGEKLAEVIFNTSMTGYQEILTDPSYKGQSIVMTYPLIGNYGVNSQDVQSSKVHCEAFIISRNSRVFSNYRAEGSLSRYLRKNRVIGLCDIDTRRLTRHLRNHGAMKGIISTKSLNVRSLLKKVRRWGGISSMNVVNSVTIKRKEIFSDKGKYNVVVIDCGVKTAILEELKKRNCRVTVIPAFNSSGYILNLNPDAVLISNGPGDPAVVKATIKTVKNLIGKLPLFGICLGHQILGIALGGKTYKLKFGHHGANHPVKDLTTGKVLISSQNHNYCVSAKSLPAGEVELTHINLYDNTEAGMRHKSLPIFSVQFHPEASPGPRESAEVFDKFISIMKDFNYAKR